VSDSYTNNLLLNKLVGGPIIRAFFEWVYWYILDFDDEDLAYVTSFVKTLVEYDGIYTCCEFLRLIGVELMIMQDSKKENRVKRFLLYQQYLEKIIPELYQQYRNLCNTIAREMCEKMSFKEWGEFVLNSKEFCVEQNPYHVDYSKISSEFESVASFVIGNDAKLVNIVKENTSDQMRAIITAVIEKKRKRYFRN